MKDYILNILNEMKTIKVDEAMIGTLGYYSKEMERKYEILCCHLWAASESGWQGEYNCVNDEIHYAPFLTQDDIYDDNNKRISGFDVVRDEYLTIWAECMVETDVDLMINWNEFVEYFRNYADFDHLTWCFIWIGLDELKNLCIQMRRDMTINKVLN